MIVMRYSVPMDGSTIGVWAIGIGILIGLIVYARAAGRRRARKHGIRLRNSRLELAQGHGWQYRDQAPEIRGRWYPGYGSDADRITPRRVVAGELNGMPFTVFDTIEKIGRAADRPESLRTVCLVHLPLALPDVRLRGRIADEERYGPMPPVADEPPWNCDLLPRMSALAQLESSDPAPPMAAESDLPGFAGALITEDVLRETLLRRVPGWRIHGRDLIFVGIPGTVLSAAEVLAMLAGLVAIAAALPTDVMRQHGQPPTAGLPLADRSFNG